MITASFRLRPFAALVIMACACFSVCACSNQAAFVPVFTYFSDLETPPIPVTAVQIRADYRTDPNAAAVKYEGKKIWITRAVVDQYAPADGEDCLYISLANVPLTTTAGAAPVPVVVIQTSAETYEINDIVEVVGTCRGITEQGIMIEIERAANLGKAPVQTIRPGY
ncbi:MAG: hypothetical protein JW954_02460 [Dehalococcoidaceae bacterium]|nr:hypothetical protein [Dehalococcoidaceae bacterium]